MFYFAYGSNLLKSGMRERCPAAIAVGSAVLPDHRFVFRLWADVEPDVGSCVAGGLWRITPACLAALDDYEEVETGLYRRFDALVRLDDGGSVEAIVFRMDPTSLHPPEREYLSIILRGYRDFGLDVGPVHAAVLR